MAEPKGNRVAHLPLQAAGWHDGPRLGRIVSAGPGEVRVDYEGNGRGSLAARVSAGIDDASLERAARDAQEALLLFASGDPGRPVVVALLRSRTPLTDAVLEAALPSASQRVARVDGKRVEIEGRDEVVLRCGRASLTLSRDGKVLLRGVKVVTHADGVHRIRGAKVEIN